MCLFSSRRRQTRCALVTGVQTCALPVSPDHCPCRAQKLRQALGDLAFVLRAGAIRRDHHGGAQGKSKYCFASGTKKASLLVRSEERRVGKERDSECRSRWLPCYSTNKQ